MDFTERPIPPPAPSTGDRRAQRGRSSRRVGRARVLIVGGAVVTSLVGAGAIVATAATHASGVSSSSSTQTSANAPSTLLASGSGTTTHATSGGS